MKHIFVLFMVVVALMVSCKRDPLPKDALKKEVFVSVLVDMHLAEAINDERVQLKKDTLNSRALFLTVLQKYKITEEQLKITTLYYSRNPKEYDKIYSEVLSKINELTEDQNQSTEMPVKKLQ